MKNYKIAVLKGDGIGPEIVNEAIKVLDVTAEKCGFTVEYEEALLGGCAIDATGVPLPEETVAKCKAADSTLLGAVGGPKWAKRVCSAYVPLSDFLPISVLPAYSSLCVTLLRCVRTSSAVHWISW